MLTQYLILTRILCNRSQVDKHNILIININLDKVPKALRAVAGKVVGSSSELVFLLIQITMQVI